MVLPGRGTDSEPWLFLADARFSLSVLCLIAGRLPPAHTCNMRAHG